MRALQSWVAVAVLLAGPASVARADAGGALPISVDSSYTATPTPDLSCGGFHVVGVGSAWGTPIGNGAIWDDAECANFVVRPGYIVINGTITLTTEYGALLVLNYSVVSPLPDATGTIYPQGTFVVDGAKSTERFANTKGSGTLSVTASVVTGAASAQIRGSYTHVNRT